ncbi:UDP-2,3-diacylglucosamine diphosphatase [Bdellovibrio svalbardensis]|uniref:UDP-2,3-diacylglucosamine diphosphatase n=1 Tax=Bdellovibrio svalbardensis TaxID=2972972 RepID=A0ABT6DFE6_9BACT|nr:UDP-2,3-diacylglucosamine diphosphatase [Bdellovibrio svalbardensis]MDG0815560.1 UDP-2,3-diacylglucosamine diphosphatase [Bdellovibrio svalbardensis]
MEAWFISDIHLKTAEERNGQILLRFLRSLLETSGPDGRTKTAPKQIHLFLLGDIFDLWIGGSTFFADQFKDLMNALEQFIKAGGRVTYIEGNHDVHIERYFQKKLGAEVFVEAQYYTIDGLKVRVEHGDLINLNDIKYLKYRSIIRNPLLKPLSYLIPGWFWSHVGNKASKKSRAKSGQYRVQNEDQLIGMIRHHIPRAYNEGPFDLIISGHMHVFDDHTVKIQNHEVRSINLGSWFEEEVRVFRLKDGKGEWIKIS